MTISRLRSDVDSRKRTSASEHAASKHAPHAAIGNHDQCSFNVLPLPRYLLAYMWQWRGALAVFGP